MKLLVAFLLTLLPAASAFGSNDYSLTMTAVFTKGEIASTHSPNEMYHAGDYDCTRGDENNAPECHTLVEWAQLDAIGGTPNIVVFTMADGSQVGVQSTTIHKIPGFLECGPGTEVIFCNLYYEFLKRQQVNLLRRNRYGQTESLPSEEYDAAVKAKEKELFGTGKTMTLTFRYKLKGKPKDGFQRIEIDKSSCVLEDGVNNCEAIPEVLNARANGYFAGEKVPLPQSATAPSRQVPPALDPAARETVRRNSQAAKSSPAAAAALASTGHDSTPDELDQLVASGRASRCGVVTDPPGAEVYIDGNKGGITPLGFVLLKQGDTPRKITIKMAGYKTVEKQAVPDGRIIPISVILEKDVPK